MSTVSHIMMCMWLPGDVGGRLGVPYIRSLKGWRSGCGSCNMPWSCISIAVIQLLTMSPYPELFDTKTEDEGDNPWWPSQAECIIAYLLPSLSLQISITRGLWKWPIRIIQQDVGAQPGTEVTADYRLPSTHCPPSFLFKEEISEPSAPPGK